jgi:hypothetical protein
VHQPEDLGIGITNTNGTVNAYTRLDTTAANAGTQVVFQSGNTYSGPGAAYNAALGGWATASGASTVGVYAYSEKSDGAAVVAWGRSGSLALRLPAFDWATKPTAGTYVLGDIVSAADGLWRCVAGGSPGIWVRIGFNPITPVRLATGQAIAASGTFNIALAGTPTIPIQATAVTFILTVASSQAGALTIYPAGVSPVPYTVGSIFPANQLVAGEVTAKLGVGGAISIVNRGSATATIYLDVTGFYS